MSKPLPSLAWHARPRWLPAMLLALLCLLLGPLTQPGMAEANTATSERALSRFAAEAGEIPRLHAVVVAEHGDIVLDHRLQGPDTDQPVNIKSLSKTVLAALVGAAIEAGLIAADDVLDLNPADLDEIHAVFEREGTLETGKLGPAHAALDGRFDYGVLRCILAELA